MAAEAKETATGLECVQGKKASLFPVVADEVEQGLIPIAWRKLAQGNMLMTFSFAKFRRRFQHKALMKGKEVVIVNESYT
ncbi:MAG: hypothetical protein LBP65_02355 [Puniceicoccales bacterium]|nr:hypothetical protein [Puniceicoccales bacterium]